MATSPVPTFCNPFKSRLPVPPEQPLFPSIPITYDAEADVYRDTAGCKFRQLFQDVPALAPFYLDAEKSYNAWSIGEFSERYMWLAFVIVAAYLIFIAVGRRIMAHRPAFGLKKPLAAWNLLLAVFSAIGFLRTAPHLVYYLAKGTFYESVCMPSEPSFGHGAAGLWTMLFIFSKVPELLDTVFIVLRKSPLIFLHWYHHATVLLYCWHSYATRSSAGLYFVAMNFGVHAIMYFYYFLAAVGIRVKWAPLVTALQISQMFVGMFICGSVYYFEGMRGLPCDVTSNNYIAGWVMYASYALLFIVFALEKYIYGTSSLDKKKRAPAADAAAAKPKSA